MFIKYRTYIKSCRIAMYCICPISQTYVLFVSR